MSLFVLFKKRTHNSLLLFKKKSQHTKKTMKETTATEKRPPYSWIVLVFLAQLAIIATYTYLEINAEPFVAVATAWVCVILAFVATALVLYMWQSVHRSSADEYYEAITIPFVIFVQLAVGASIAYVSGGNTVEGVLVTWMLFVAAALIVFIHRFYLSAAEPCCCRR